MPIRLALSMVICAALVAGCRIIPGARELTPHYKPGNVHVRSVVLPTDIRRVLVLPIVFQAGSRETAKPDWAQAVFTAELAKTKLFDLVSIGEDELRALTSKASWTAEDELPPDIFKRLREATGCDGIMFVALTVFQPYPPLRTGWKARLVDCQDQSTWWAIDEVFDAGLDSVAGAARSYARKEMNLPNATLGDGSILQSPRRFGQYTAGAVAKTLPHR